MTCILLNQPLAIREFFLTITYILYHKAEKKTGALQESVYLWKKS